MSRKQKGSRESRQPIQVWSHEQAKALLPYVASIVTSLREHKLAAMQHDLTARRLAARPGRPDRDALLAHQEAVEEARRADERFEQALDELHALDVHCLDPLAGQALIPFVHDDQLAWYVFDLFDSTPLRSWRYHSDPLEKRRPLDEISTPAAESTTWLA
jgi:hypothetical protein